MMQEKEEALITGFPRCRPPEKPARHLAFSNAAAKNLLCPTGKEMHDQRLLLRMNGRNISVMTPNPIRCSTA